MLRSSSFRLALAPLALALTAGSAAAQTTHVVTLQGTTFTPADITIDVGDTVQWDWAAGLHNVVSGLPGAPDGIFSSGVPVLPPMSFSLTFDQAFLDANPVTGKRYDYTCVVHENFGMVGSVTIDVPASGVSRSAAGNPDSLVLVNPPQLGGVFQATQDLSLTGHALAAIVGYAGPLTFPLAGGQVLLVNVTDPGGELLGQPAVPGPVVLWNLSVPNDAALCGFELSVQGVHIGGVTPFALSNALDLVVGN